MSKRKKILILPAIDDHVNAINLCKKRGYKVVVCDDVPSNTGHIFADISYNIDLLDYAEVVAMAKKESIDFVWAYSTDIGALAAAKVSDALHLKSNSYQVVETMSDKSLFRRFLKDNDFNCPSFVNATLLDDLLVGHLKFPLVVKPVDRASSKGITVVKNTSALASAFENAKSASIGGGIIAEEYIQSKSCQLHGDAVVCDGEIVLFAVGDQYFSTHNTTAPIGTVFPSLHDVAILRLLEEDVQRFISTIGFLNGGINIEARVDNEGKVFLIELGPRSGGNYIPELISHYMCIDVKGLLLDCVTGVTSDVIVDHTRDNTFQFIWRSSLNGELLHKSISSEVEILEEFVFKTEGDYISADAGADNIIAILILKAVTRKQVEDIYSQPDDYFKLSVV